MPSLWLSKAISKLYPHVMWWIHYPSEGKQELLNAYTTLQPREKAAYDADVREAFVRAHGSDTTIAYRRVKSTDEHVAGLSLSSLPCPSHVKCIAYRICPDDVLVHWAQTDMPLSGKAFGHEKEIILRTEAKPVLIMSNPNVDALDLSSVVESGVVFETGTPVTFTYLHAKTKAPRYGSTYQQDIEPAGRYIVHQPAGLKAFGEVVTDRIRREYEEGTVTFRNPLVLVDTLGALYGSTSWKARLSKSFKAKGKSLSKKLAKAGYDGIVTVRNGEYTGEIVDLTMFAAKSNPLNRSAWILADGTVHSVPEYQHSRVARSLIKSGTVPERDASSPGLFMEPYDTMWYAGAIRVREETPGYIRMELYKTTKKSIEHMQDYLSKSSSGYDIDRIEVSEEGYEGRYFTDIYFQDFMSIDKPSDLRRIGTLKEYGKNPVTKLNRRSVDAIVAKVQAALTDDLRKPKYRGHPNPMAGHCYVATEALYFALGGKAAGWQTMNVKHENDSHWFLQHKSGLIVDATASQFKTPVPYDKAHPQQRMPKAKDNDLPSKRARIVLQRIGVKVARMNSTITPKQLAALAAICAETKRLDENERERWGKSHSGWVGTPVGVSISTLNILARDGFLVRASKPGPHSTQIKRGRFGRGFTSQSSTGSLVTWKLTQNGATVCNKHVAKSNPLLADPPVQMHSLQGTGGQYFRRVVGRPVTGEDYYGVHTTSDFVVAMTYAQQASEHDPGSYPVVITICVDGLQELPDVDSVVKANELDRSYLGDDVYDEAPFEEGPDEMVVGNDPYYLHIYSMQQRSAASAFIDVYGDDAQDKWNEWKLGGETPSEVASAITTQRRWATDIHLDRVVSVQAFKLVYREIFDAYWDMDDEDLTRRVKAIEKAGYNIVTIEDYMSVPQDTVEIYGGNVKCGRTEYHGTSSTRLKMAFPEMAVPSEPPFPVSDIVESDDEEDVEENPTRNTMCDTKQNPTDREDHALRIVHEFIVDRGFEPSIKIPEAKQVVSAYLRTLGYQADRYGNFLDSTKPGTRFHFSKQMVQEQRKFQGEWRNRQTISALDSARRIVVDAARHVGDEVMLAKWSKAKQAKVKAKAKAGERRAKASLQKTAAILAMKQLGFEHPRAVAIAGKGKLDAEMLKTIKDRQAELVAGYMADLEAGKPEPKDDSVFASVDKPPTPPLFFDFEYLWSETVDGVEYTVHVKYAQKSVAIVTIGSSGGLGMTVNPRTMRMEACYYTAKGDAQITGQIGFNGEMFLGSLFMIVSREARKGAGTRVLSLWCRMMSGYGIEAWRAEAVGEEGLAFLKALQVRGLIDILTSKGSTLLVRCKSPNTIEMEVEGRKLLPEVATNPTSALPPGFEGFEEEDVGLAEAGHGDKHQVEALLQETPSTLSASRLLKPAAISRLAYPAVFYFGRNRAWMVQVDSLRTAQSSGTFFHKNLVGKRLLTSSDPQLHHARLYIAYPSGYIMVEGPPEEVKDRTKRNEKEMLVYRGKQLFGEKGFRLSGGAGNYTMQILPYLKEFKGVFSASTFKASTISELNSRLDSVVAELEKHGIRFNPVASTTDLSTIIYNLINESYESWEEARKYNPKAREPRFSIGLIKEDLDQRGGLPDSYRYVSRKKQYNQIKAALDKLVRAGKLKTSLGHGLKGPESKLYEPARDNQVKDNPRGWRTPVRPAPGARHVNWAKVAELVNAQLAGSDIHVGPSKSALKWFKHYEGQKWSHSISRTEARRELDWKGIDLDKMVDKAINDSFGEYALNPVLKPWQDEDYFWLDKRVWIMPDGKVVPVGMDTTHGDVAYEMIGKAGMSPNDPYAALYKAGAIRVSGTEFAMKKLSAKHIQTIQIYLGRVMPKRVKPSYMICVEEDTIGGRFLKVPVQDFMTTSKPSEVVELAKSTVRRNPVEDEPQFSEAEVVAKCEKQYKEWAELARRGELMPHSRPTIDYEMSWGYTMSQAQRINECGRKGYESVAGHSREQWLIPEYNMGELQKRIERFEKKSAKLKLDEPIRVEVVGDHVKKVLNKRGEETGHVEVYKIVEITGKAPHVSGHTFIARVQHTEAGNIVDRAPNVDDVKLPKSLWTAKATCDHCKMVRTRNETFVLRNDGTNKLIRVGRSCLADFLRSEDAEAALALWSLMRDLKELSERDEDEEGGGGSWGGRQYLDMKGYLSRVVRVIEVSGWISSKQAFERGGRSSASAAEWASNELRANAKYEEVKEWKSFQPTPESDAQAEKVINWAQRLKPTNDYERNIQVIAGLDYVPPKSMGFAASMVAAYRREVEKELGAKRDAETKLDEWFGKVESRYVRRLTLVGMFEFETQYGITTIYSFEDDKRRVFKWFASDKVHHPAYAYDNPKNAENSERDGRPFNDMLAIGDTCWFTFTIKKHDTWTNKRSGRTEKQTVITRATPNDIEPTFKWMGPDGEVFKSKKEMSGEPSTASKLISYNDAYAQGIIPAEEVEQETVAILMDSGVKPDWYDYSEVKKALKKVLKSRGVAMPTKPNMTRVMSKWATMYKEKHEGELPKENPVRRRSRGKKLLIKDMSGQVVYEVEGPIEALR